MMKALRNHATPIIASIGIIFGIFYIASTALAFDPTSITLPNPEIPIPGMENLFKYTNCGEGTKCAIPWIGQYLQVLYKYGLGIIGLLATVAMMIGGLQWMMSAGDASKITSAKNMLSGSITGLVIALTSYIILYQINPELTFTKPLSLMTIKEIPIEAGNETSEAVVSGQTKGMECFYDKYGKSEEEVQARLTKVPFMGTEMWLSPKAAQALRKAETEIRNNYNGNYRVKNGGSFNWRANVNDPSQQSLHSFGIAFDLNPETNPNYRKNSSTASCKSDIPQEIITALKNNGFRWGGDYTTVCDAMHFEWIEECKK